MPPPAVTVIGNPVRDQRARPDHPGYDRQLSGTAAHVRWDGEVFVTAHANEDTETQRDLLGDQIPTEVLPDWSGRPWGD